MTDDELRKYLRKENPFLRYVGVALAVGGSVWAASEWLHSRSSTQDVTRVQNNVFQIRLDQETMKGDLKALQLQIRVDEKLSRIDGKLDDLGKQRRR